MSLTLSSNSAATLGRSRALVRIRTRCGIVSNVMRERIIYGIMESHNREISMDDKQAKALGELLRSARKELELSTRQVSTAAGVNQATVVRLESGQNLNPDPAKLQTLATTLKLNLADVLSMAGYPIPTDLPSPGPYLRTKFRNLPTEAVDQLQGQIADVLRQHGIEPGDGPNEGEDELPEDARPSPTTNKH